MSIHNKSLSLITAMDIEELVSNQVRESKVIDYKRILPEINDKSKKEFLADVASFANAGGGDLVYGVVENHGVPSRVAGLKIKDLEGEMLRIEHIIRDGIDPRIYGVSVRGVEVKPERFVVIVRIPRSWSAPHMVSFQGYGKFFSRNSYGKHPLDTSELRVAFSLSQESFDHLRDFRLQRLGALTSANTPIGIDESASKMVLHICPLSINNPTLNIDISQFEFSQVLPTSIFDNQAHRQRFNFDGFVQYTDSTYFQIFRTGAIELVETNFLSYSKGKQFIDTNYEGELLEKLDALVTFLKAMRIEPPFLIMLSLLGVGNTFMGKNSDFHWYDSQPIDRRELIIPEVLVEDYGVHLSKVMKPAFYAVWNAAGWPRSMNYNEEGEWIGLE
jgi:Putative DNA-binding domain